jgi:hypothetical protein
MLTQKEIALKNFNITQETLQRESQKIESKLLFSFTINLSERPNYKAVVKKLRFFFNHNHFRWVNLHLVFRWKVKDESMGFSYHEEDRFLFGRRKFIVRNIKEISSRVVKGELWNKKEAGISSGRRFKMKDFL